MMALMRSPVSVVSTKVPPVPAQRRRWLRRLLFALGLAGAIYLGRESLLRGVARVLVVEDPVQQVDAVVLFDGDHLYEQAALLYRDGLARRILLIEGSPSRLVRMEILPNPAALAQGELAKMAVPANALEILKMDKSGDWNYARRLRDWLNEHPGAHVCLLCDRFSSRRTHCLFTQVLGELSARVHWRALPDRRYDEQNWQRDKVGILGLFDGYLSWGHVWWYGDAQGDQEEWNPDTYQNNLR
jgi:hypothetical protein